jgi:hypothetical protein|tara:strand:+ start:1421 stop:1870 length:450 start_codon:yes stop_codon:yes gene_type:complete
MSGVGLSSILLRSVGYGRYWGCYYVEDGGGQKQKVKTSGVLLVVWILLSSPPVNAESVHKTPEEPQFSDMVEWKLHFSLGVVVEHKDGTLYSYPIRSKYPVQECRKVRVANGEVYLMDGELRYIIPLKPMLYRKPPNDWEMWEMMEYGQ